MKRFIVLALLVMVLTMVFAIPASAHEEGPCNGGETGQEYAEHHIVEKATTGGMGEGGHKPGSHRGFLSASTKHNQAPSLSRTA